jgi:hypothetical protein
MRRRSLKWLELCHEELINALALNSRQATNSLGGSTHYMLRGSETPMPGANVSSLPTEPLDEPSLGSRYVNPLESDNSSDGWLTRRLKEPGVGQLEQAARPGCLGSAGVIRP